MVFIQYIPTIGKLYGKFRVVIEELVNQSGEEEANGCSDPQDHSVLGVKPRKKKTVWQMRNVPDISPIPCRVNHTVLYGCAVPTKCK